MPSILGAFLSVIPSPIYGANVVNNNFLKALLKHSSFDEIHLFYDSLSLIRAERGVKELIKLSEEFSKLRLKNIISLPASLREVDYLAFHSGNPFWGKVSPLTGKSAIPLTGTAHTISYHFALNDLMFNLLNARPFDSIICTSSSQKKALQELLELISEKFTMLGIEARYEGRLDLIPLGVDTSLYRPRDKFDARTQIELPQDKLIILWVGRFSAYDKADLFPLLVVFKKVAEKHPDMVLVLAGDDKHRYGDKVKTLAGELGIADKVIFKLDPPVTSLPLLYSASDVFIAPSDSVQETFGLVVIEAMASGLPVVVSDWNGYKELVIHCEIGFKVPTYWARCDGMIRPVAPLTSWLVNHLYLAQSVCVDLGKMEEYLLALVENPELRSRMGEKAREHAVANYDWKTIVKRYEELWMELKEEAKRRGREVKRVVSFEPQYFRVFNHYPTEVLDEESQIKLTESGKKLLGGEGKTVEFYAEMRALLDPSVMEEIVTKLGETDGWVKVGEVADKIRETHGVPSEIVIFQIMWMMKYGVLESKKRGVNQDGS